jgi:hypothetical protein
MGMTWNLVCALSAISSTWIMTRVPRFGVLVANREFARLDRLAAHSGLVATAVAALGAAALYAIIAVLSAIGHPIADRLLPPLPTALFLIATVLMQVSYTQSSYLRAHKKEPFLLLSLVTSMLIAAAAVVFGRDYGATGIATGYLAVVVVLVIPWGTLVFLSCRRQWHGADEGGASTGPCD